MRRVIAVCVLSVVGLAGCAVMAPGNEPYRFSNEKSEFSFVKIGCVLDQGKFTDRSGKGNSYPYIRVIAITNGGETVGQWSASCRAVVPNGSSSCSISGPQKAFFECTNYHTFQVFL